MLYVVVVGCRCMGSGLGVGFYGCVVYGVGCLGLGCRMYGGSCVYCVWCVKSTGLCVGSVCGWVCKVEGACCDGGCVSVRDELGINRSCVRCAGACHRRTWSLRRVLLTTPALVERSPCRARAKSHWVQSGPGSACEATSRGPRGSSCRARDGG